MASGPVELDAVTSAPLAVGYLADIALGDPARLHPVAGFGAVAARLEHMAWRPRRTTGAIYATTLVGSVFGIALVADRMLPRRARSMFVAVLTWTALGGTSLGRVARRLADAVSSGDLDEARRIVPSLVGRDPSSLDGQELCRAAVESVAENTADAIVAPLVWAAVAGPAGIAAYRAVNTLDAMVGHRSERYERFGWASARLDDILTWPAARLTALLAVLLAPIADGDSASAWRVLQRDGAAHPSPNAGRCEAAFAGALGVRLGGTNVYGGRAEHRPQLGDGRAPGPQEVRRAIRLSRAIGLVSAALCALLAR